MATALGQTVGTAQLRLAELSISIRTGVEISDPEVVEAMEATDRYWLAQAVVFQAIWLKGQPDLLSRLDMNQTSTDGDAFTVNHDGLMLAPMAKWCILKTSVMTWNTVDVEPTQNTLGAGYPTDIQSIGYRRWGAGYR